VNSDPTGMVSFEQVGCMSFYEKVHGYSVHLTKHFSMNFNGVSTTIAGVTFPVSEETISAATEIVGMFHRKSVLVIDGKNNNDDGKQESGDESSKIQTSEDMQGVHRSIIQISVEVTI
jgi:hypothetical protein